MGKPKKMKPHRCYAIVAEGRLVTTGNRDPLVYGMKEEAERDCDEEFADRVVLVEIKEVEK